RVPLYKHAVNPLMDTCADLVGIAYSPEGLITDSKGGALAGKESALNDLVYWDSNQGSNNTYSSDSVFTNISTSREVSSNAADGKIQYDYYVNSLSDSKCRIIFSKSDSLL
ncbi:MAG: hypothetical protein MJY67_04165, partial [Bacteroidales bacterium]|nr:hypothetical protein [Bacteroidales bacterium]